MVEVDLLPDNAEAHGLAALLLHSDACVNARRDGDGDGRFPPLAEQDISRWSLSSTTAAESHLATALALRQLGPHQLQAVVYGLKGRDAR